MSSIEKLKDEARRYELREEWSRAVDTYLKVLRAAETSATEPDLNLYNRVGDLYLRLGRPADAVVHYEKAAERYAAAGFYNNAIALCNKALRHQPHRAELYLLLSRYSAEQGFLADARSWLLEYVERKLRAGEAEAALEPLADFARRNGDPESRELLSGYLLEAGRKGEALEQLGAAYVSRVRARETGIAERLAERIRALDPDVDLDEVLASAPPEPEPGNGLPSFGESSDPEAPIAATRTGGLPGLQPHRAEPEPPAQGDAVAGLEPTALDDEAAVAPADAEDEADESAPAEDEPPSATAAAGLFDAGAGTLEPSAATDDRHAGEEYDEEWPPPLPLLDEAAADPEPDAHAAGADPAADRDGAGSDVVAESVTESITERVDADRAEADGEERVPGPVSFEEADAGESEDDWAPRPVVVEATEEPESEDEPAPRPASADETEAAQSELDRARELAAAGDRAGAFAALDSLHGELAAAGRLDEAIAVVREQVSLDPSSLRSYQRWVDYAFRVGSTPALVAACLALADHLKTRGADRQAAAVYQRVLHLDPGNVEARSALGGDSAPAPRAAAEYVDLAELLVEPPRQRTTRWVVPERTPSGDADRDFSETVAEFKARVTEQIGESDAASRFDLGLAFRGMGLVEESIGEFQAALRAGADRLRVYEELGQCFMLRRQFQIAAKILERALTLPQRDDDEMVGVFYHLGRCYEELRRPEEARDAYERVIGLDFEFQDAAERLARL